MKSARRKKKISKSSRRILLKGLGKWMLAGVIVVALLGGIKFVQWYNSADRIDLQVELAKINGGLPLKHINLFVSPDWLVGVDQQNQVVKYTNFAQSVDTAELSILAKKEHALVDAYLVLPSDMDEIGGLTNYVWAGLFNKSVKTNLTPRQLVDLWLYLRKNVPIQPLNQFWMPEDMILNEAFPIAVKNGTLISGLAGEAGEWIRMIGGDVVEMENNEQSVTKTKIIAYLPAEAKSNTLLRLEQIFNTTVIYEQNDNPLPYDIEVIVGADFAR